MPMWSMKGPVTFLERPDADVVTGVCSPTATAVRGEQVVPALVIDQVRCFAVDRDVHGLVARVETRAGLGIELDQPDVAKIGAIDQPELAVGGVQKDPGIDGIAELDAIGRGDDPGLLPLVVGRIGVEGLAPYHVDGGLGLGPDVRGNIQAVAVAEMDDVGSHSTTAGRDSATPGPAIVGDQACTAGAIGVEPPVAPDEGGGIVDLDLAIEGQRGRGPQGHRPHEKRDRSGEGQ